MHIYSHLNDDIPHNLPSTGGYEWWYFDFIDWKNQISGVIILYRGNPFSRRYITQEESGLQVKSHDFPAYSISIYKNDETKFFHFREFEPGSQITFELDTIRLSNAISMKRKDSQWNLRVNDVRPDGVGIDLDLTFDGSDFPIRKGFSSEIPEPSEPHAWNLLHARTHVSGNILINKKSKTRLAVNIDALGYHDHNFGDEPMKNGFRDWIWARFHFPDESLVLYAFREKDYWDFNVWKFVTQSDEVISSKVVFGLENGINVPNVFGLRAPKAFSFEVDGVRYDFDATKVLDSGPFYMRFLPRLWRNSNPKEEEFVFGISEYIKPSRIYSKIFWPLVNMRMRYDAEKPHWVQKIEFFFNWTL